MDDQANEIPGKSGPRRAESRFDGSAFTVIWTQPISSGASAVYATKIGPDGTLLGSPISLPADSCPHIAWNGTEHLLAWSDSSGIRAVRLASDLSVRGAVYDVTGTVSRTSRRLSAVAASPTGFLVCWDTGLPIPDPGSLSFAAIVTAEGVAAPIALPGWSLVSAAGIWNFNAGWVVVTTGAGISLIGADGTTTAGPGFSSASVASDPAAGGVLIGHVVQKSLIPRPPIFETRGDYDVYVTRLVGGVALDEIALSPAADSERVRGAVFAGGSFLVQWDDSAPGKGTGILSTDGTSVTSIAKMQGVLLAGSGDRFLLLSGGQKLSLFDSTGALVAGPLVLWSSSVSSPTATRDCYGSRSLRGIVPS